MKVLRLTVLRTITSARTCNKFILHVQIYPNKASDNKSEPCRFYIIGLLLFTRFSAAFSLNKFSRSTRLQIAFPAQHYNLMAFSWLRKRFFNWGSLQLNYKCVHPRLPRCNLVGQRMKEVISHGDFIHALPTASDANLNSACAMQKHSFRGSSPSLCSPLIVSSNIAAHSLLGEDRKYWM